MSFKKPNKRYAIPGPVRKQRILDYLQNIFRVRHFFWKRFNHHIPVISADQMPLHRLESSSNKTFGFTGAETHVKESYMHSRERMTVMTFMCSDGVPMMPEFVFKGLGIRVKIPKIPPGVHIQWSESGSYRLKHVLEMVNRLPTLRGPMDRSMGTGMKKFKLFTLDNYSAHLDPMVC